MTRTFAALAFTGFAALLPAQAQAQEHPKLNLQFAHFVAATLPGATVDQWFADELAKRTAGNVKMQIFWAESAGKATEVLRLAGQGGVDVGATSAGYFPAQLPFLSAATMPVAKSAKQAKEAWTKLYLETPALQKEARDNGVMPQVWHPIPPYRLLCRMPIRTLQDLQGKRIRSFGEDFPRIWQAVGATPVTVLPGEWYESLQRGSVDCMMHSLDTMATYKIYEVAKFASSLDLGAIISWPQWWNLKKWQALPEHTKAVLTTLAKESEAVEIKRLDDATIAAVKTMKESGVEFVEFKDAEKFAALRPDFISDWVIKLSKLGKTDDAEAMAKRWRELLVAAE